MSEPNRPVCLLAVAMLFVTPNSCVADDPPRELIIQLADPVAYDSLVQSLGEHFQVSLHQRPESWLVVRTSAGPQVIDHLREQRGVLTVVTNTQSEQDPIKVRVGRVTPNDELYSQQWALHSTKADSAWIKRTLTPLVVAIIDFGVDIDHPDLKENIWTNSGETGQGRESNGLDDDGNGYVDDLHGWSFPANNADVTDDDPFSHGTHCAGIIGAVGCNGRGVSGVNWRVRLMPVRVGKSIDSIADGIEYAVNNGASIINVSLTTDLGMGHHVSPDDPLLTRLRQAVNRAEKRGVLLVCAAGHIDYGAPERFGDRDVFPTYPSSFQNRNIISVLALDEYNKLAAYSAYGRYSCDIAAPGGDTKDKGLGIISTVRTDRERSGYGELAGTSQAAAHVSGAAALVWGCPRFRSMSAVQIKELLLSRARKDERLRWRCVSGGRLDLSLVAEAEAHSKSAIESPQWALQSIGVNSFKSGKVKCNTRVIVGIVDTGVDYEHSDLARFMWRNPGESGNGKESNGLDDDGNGIVDDVYGANFTLRSRNGRYLPDGDPLDFDGHGTNVAGIVRMVAGLDESKNGGGLALMAVKVTTARGGGMIDSFLLGLDYAIENGCQIINCSFVFPSEDVPSVRKLLLPRLEKCRERGIVLVCAAGNLGTNIDDAPLIPASVEHESVVTVLATGEDGTELPLSCVGRRSVSIGAPGEFVSAWPFGGRYHAVGTSMAAAAVSGGLARQCAMMAPALAESARRSLIANLRRDTRLESVTRYGGTLNLSHLANHATTPEMPEE